MASGVTCRELKRSPVGSLDHMIVVELGSALELELERGVVIRWRKHSAPLLWSAPKKALFVFERTKKGRHQPMPPDTPADVRRSFQAWAKRGATRKRTDSVTSTGASWRACGRVVRLDYASDKWGVKREYTHDTGPQVRLYSYGTTSRPSMWAIHGGRLTVTARGIVG